MEESREPADHYLVVGPPSGELPEEVLVVERAERREDGVGEVGVEGEAVALVEVFGVVLGGFLGAHVVDCCVEEHVVLGSEGWLRGPFQDAFQLCDAGFHERPSFLQGDWCS